MNADVVAQILFWVTAALFIGGLSYLMHRLTAPAAKRFNGASERGHYNVMITRGQQIPLPKTWLSGGLAGHDWNTEAEFSQIVRSGGGAILAAFAVGLFLRRDVLTVGQVLAEAAIGLVIVGGLFLGLRVYARRRVKRQIAAAGQFAPRGAFKVVANGHGLFVPIADRVIEGAWGDWSVADVEIDIDKYGRGICHAITLAHRDRPNEKVPVIASTFQNGDELMAVLAARVARP